MSVARPQVLPDNDALQSSFRAFSSRTTICAIQQTKDRTARWAEVERAFRRELCRIDAESLPLDAEMQAAAGTDSTGVHFGDFDHAEVPPEVGLGADVLPAGLPARS